MRADASTNVWIWTECARGEKYSRFKKINWFYNNAVPFDSETLDFVHCPANRKLYIKADRVRAAGEGGVHIQSVICCRLCKMRQSDRKAHTTSKIFKIYVCFTQ